MTNNQLASFLVKKIEHLHMESMRHTDGEIEKLARATSKSFDDVYKIMKDGFSNLERNRSEMENRLIDKIEAVHANAHHRIDRLEDKIHNLV